MEHHPANSLYKNLDPPESENHELLIMNSEVEPKGPDDRMR